MKIIVISDTHYTTNLAISAVLQSTPELIIFLGDMQSDCEVIRNEFKDIPLLCVSGNSEYTYTLQKEIITTICDKKFLICHGDLYNVKQGITQIVEAAIAKDVDVCLFGHTHASRYEIKKGIHFLNPGSCKNSYGAKASYGIIDIVGSDVCFQIKNIEEENV